MILFLAGLLVLTSSAAIMSGAVALRALGYGKYRDRSARLTKECMILRADKEDALRRLAAVVQQNNQTPTMEIPAVVRDDGRPWLSLDWPPKAKFGDVPPRVDGRP